MSYAGAPTARLHPAGLRAVRLIVAAAKRLSIGTLSQTSAEQFIGRIDALIRDQPKAEIGLSRRDVRPAPKTGQSTCVYRLWTLTPTGAQS